MNCTNFIDLCSDEEFEEVDAIDVKPILPLQIDFDQTVYSAGNQRLSYRDCTIKQELDESRSSNSTSSITEQACSSANVVCQNFDSSSVRLCRQFWKSGDYEVGQAISSTPQSIFYHF